MYGKRHLYTYMLYIIRCLLLIFFTVESISKYVEVFLSKRVLLYWFLCFFALNCMTQSFSSFYDSRRLKRKSMSVRLSKGHSSWTSKIFFQELWESNEKLFCFTKPSTFVYIFSNKYGNTRYASGVKCFFRPQRIFFIKTKCSEFSSLEMEF